MGHKVVLHQYELKCHSEVIHVVVIRMQRRTGGW